MQYGEGRWYTQRVTPYVILHAQVSCMVWEGYNLTSGGYRQTITEKLLDGSIPEFCMNVTQDKLDRSG